MQEGASRPSPGLRVDSACAASHHGGSGAPHSSSSSSRGSRGSLREAHTNPPRSRRRSQAKMKPRNLAQTFLRLPQLAACQRVRLLLFRAPSIHDDFSTHARPFAHLSTKCAKSLAIHLSVGYCFQYKGDFPLPNFWHIPEPIFHGGCIVPWVSKDPRPEMILCQISCTLHGVMVV